MGKQLSRSEELFLQTGVVWSEAELPPPPCQVGDVHLKFIGVRFAAGMARALLPPELEPVDGDPGLICVYSADSGSVAAPFSACYAAVEVKGYNAPDGSSGYYIAEGYYSGGGLEFMHRYLNLNPVEGNSRQFREGDIEVGVGGPPGIDAVEMRMRTPKVLPPVATGVHHYLGKRPGGGSTVFPIAFNGIIASTEPISIDIADFATERMRLARPVAMTFALECTAMSLTFGAPQAVGEPSRLVENAGQATLLNSFARVGRAALIVSETGEVRNMSAHARMLMGDGLVLSGAKLRTSRLEDQKELDRLIVAATRDGGDLSLPPIRLTRRNAGPLIVDIVPIGSAATGQPSALILLNDPAMPVTGNTGAALQLLGLTPAEARIAELVGSGRSPREAAEQVANAESTVRTSLARIYQKLQINRQAELARIVARL
jgi:DNA-binding CsgD family transcriptional regulator